MKTLLFYLALIAVFTLLMGRALDVDAAGRHQDEQKMRVHDCPSAMQYGDELDIDYWC